MMGRGAVRALVAAGWFLDALLIERIVTLGGITDISGAFDNPPIFLAIGLGLIVVAVAMAVATALGVSAWPAISAGLGALFIVAGLWFRIANDDDSGVAIALISALVAVVSFRVHVGRQRAEDY